MIKAFYLLFPVAYYSLLTNLATFPQPADSFKNSIDKHYKYQTPCNMELDGAELFFMQKTACYGECPIFSMKVYKNGKAFLKGVKHIPYIGCYQADIPIKTMTTLKEQFVKARFFQFKDRYYQEVTDLPTTYIYFKDKGKEKKIMDYYGAPADLKALEKQLELLVTSVEWKKVTEK